MNKNRRHLIKEPQIRIDQICKGTAHKHNKFFVL